MGGTRRRGNLTAVSAQLPLAAGVARCACPRLWHLHDKSVQKSHIFLIVRVLARKCKQLQLLTQRSAPFECKRSAT